MTEESAKCICQMDEELCAIVAALQVKHPNYVYLQKPFSMKDCVIDNYQDQVKDKANAATYVKLNTAFGKHNISCAWWWQNSAYFGTHCFETDLSCGLVTFKDITNMVGVETPLIDAMIKWKQMLIGKDYVQDDMSLRGADIGECIHIKNGLLHQCHLLLTKHPCKGGIIVELECTQCGMYGVVNVHKIQYCEHLIASS